MIKSFRAPSLDSITENGRGKPDICNLCVLAVGVVLWRGHESTRLLSYTSE